MTPICLAYLVFALVVMMVIMGNLPPEARA